MECEGYLIRERLLIEGLARVLLTFCSKVLVFVVVDVERCLFTSSCLFCTDCCGYALCLLTGHDCSHKANHSTCPKVVPLWGAAEKWFTISEERYKEKGLKCPDINVLAWWERVMKRAKSQEEGLGSIFELVREATSDLIGDLSNAEVPRPAKVESYFRPCWD